MFDFLKIRTAVDDLASQLTRLTDEIEQLKRTREDIESAPLPKTDVVARLHTSIDTLANAGRENMKGLQRLITDAQAPTPGEILPVLGFDQSGQWDSRKISPENLALLLGEQLKVGIAAAVGSMPWPDGVGLPLAERLRKLADIDAKIGKAEGELRSLRELADNAGLRMTRFDSPDRPEKYAGGRPRGDGEAVANRKP